MGTQEYRSITDGGWYAPLVSMQSPPDTDNNCAHDAAAGGCGTVAAAAVSTAATNEKNIANAERNCLIFYFLFSDAKFRPAAKHALKAGGEWALEVHWRLERPWPVEARARRVVEGRAARFRSW
jgi:hypothetical protein